MNSDNKFEKNKFTKRQLVLNISMAMAISASSALCSADSSVFEMDIKQKPVSAALFELAETSGVQIVLGSDVEKNIQLPAIQGSFTIATALNKMLEGSGLSYEFTSDDLVLVSESDGKSEDAEEEVDEEVVVTGTRIRNVAPTSPVLVITRDDIERQGLSSAEDIVRSVPQNFSSVNVATSWSEAGRDRDTPYGAEGHSFANLRGLGNGATLILVNGRRTATSASFDGGKVNLGNIPAGAIERVEILLDGASAIYGADALGGVINFILQEGYSGGKTSIRYENAVNDGNHYSLNQTFGFGWGSGSATIQLGYSERDSVSAFKAGLDSRDFTSRGGANHLSSNLSRAYGTSGNVVTDADGTHLGSLPEGHDGVNWTVGDLSIDNVRPYDSAKFGQGGTVRTESKNLNFNIEQDLTERFSLFADGSYSVAENNATNGASLGFFRVPTTNPYNKTGEEVIVRYVFSNEVDQGLLDYGKQYNKYTSMGLTAGVRAELFGDWQASGFVTLSRTKSFNDRDFIHPWVTRDPETGEITEMSALAMAIAGVDLDGNPVAAFNPFGDQNAHGEGIDFASFMSKSTASNPSMDLMTFEASANGTVMEIPGGDIKMALGLTYRPEELDITNDSRKFVYKAGDNTKWKQEATAAFFEASVPLISESNALPWVDSLLLTVAGRYDEYNFDGPFDGPDNPHTSRSYNHFSPKFGFLWQPTDTLKIRASWSESFRAPGLRVLLEGETDWRHEEEVLDPNTGQFVLLPFFRGGNPDIQPETSVVISGGFDWAPEFAPGLVISATYSEFDWQDRIGLARPWNPYVREHINEFPDVFIRDESGTLVKVVQKDVNLAQKLVESADVTVSYDFDTDWGHFTAQLSGTVNLKNIEQVFPNSPVEETIETEQGPDKVTYNVRFGWDNAGYGADLYYRYSSDYINNATGGEWVFDNGWQFISNPPAPVEHWSTWDLTGYCELEDGMKLNAGVRNLLNNKFPFIDDQNRGYDGSRVDTRGRVMYVEFTKEFDF